MVPDLHRAGAVVPLRDLALEGGVLERVILDVHRQVLRAGLERHALRHRPARQRAVALEAEVVVEAGRIVALDDEDRRGAALAAAEGLGRPLRVALAAVVAQRLAHRGGPPLQMFRVTLRGDSALTRSVRGSRDTLLHPAGGQLRSALAGLNTSSGPGISLWKVWKVPLFSRAPPWNETSRGAALAAPPGECCPLRPTRLRGLRPAGARPRRDRRAHRPPAPGRCRR